MNPPVSEPDLPGSSDAPNQAHGRNAWTLDSRTSFLIAGAAFVLLALLALASAIDFSKLTAPDLASESPEASTLEPEEPTDPAAGGELGDFGELGEFGDLGSYGDLAAGFDFDDFSAPQSGQRPGATNGPVRVAPIAGCPGGLSVGDNLLIIPDPTACGFELVEPGARGFTPGGQVVLVPDPNGDIGGFQIGPNGEIDLLSPGEVGPGDFVLGQLPDGSFQLLSPNGDAVEISPDDGGLSLRDPSGSRFVPGPGLGGNGFEINRNGLADSADLDGDGRAEAFDLDGDGTFESLDIDGDGRTEAFDADGDGQADAFDHDGDGLFDSFDLNGDGLSESFDRDGDGRPDDFDLDGDGRPDAFDSDRDGQPDAFDLDGDGAPDAFDSDRDGQPDAFDLDGDGQAETFDLDGDGRSDAIDLDGDGAPDAFDLDGDGEMDSRDTNGDGQPDEPAAVAAEDQPIQDDDSDSSDASDSPDDSDFDLSALAPIVIVALAVVLVAAVFTGFKGAAASQPVPSTLVEPDAEVEPELVDYSVEIDALTQLMWQIEQELDPRTAIRQAYAALETGLGRPEMARRQSETPGIYLRRMLGQFDELEAPLNELTWLFEQARFSEHEITPQMRDQAIAILGGVRNHYASVTAAQIDDDPELVTT